MYGEAFLVADVGEVEYHRQTNELIAPLANDSSTTGDDDLGEVVMKRYAVVAEGHRRVAIDDKRGQR